MGRSRGGEWGGQGEIRAVAHAFKSCGVGQSRWFALAGHSAIAKPNAA